MPSQLEDALQAATQDLRYASQTIQADLDRFQRQKIADLRDMSLVLAGSHRDWCKKVSNVGPRFGVHSGKADLTQRTEPRGMGRRPP